MNEKNPCFEAGKSTHTTQNNHLNTDKLL